MTHEELAALEALHAASTPGIWAPYSEEGPAQKGGFAHSVCADADTIDHQCVTQAVGNDEAAAKANAAFIAEAHQAVPRLIAEIRALRYAQRVAGNDAFWEERRASFER